MAAAEDGILMYPGVAAIDPAAWDACACPEAANGGRPSDPFTTHRFLAALEQSGSVGPGTGWQPCPIVLVEGGRIVAVAPLYAKSHSYGEYVFDHAWAEAYQRAGGRYYPKLQLAVPFTPVPGRRILTAPDAPADAAARLLAAAAGHADLEGMSSLHVTFCTEAERAAAPQGFLHRIGQQYHWQNAGYGCFDDFLAALASRKRKAIRRERAAAQGFGGEIRVLTGDAIQPRHWDAFWTFYQDTGARKWGQPYLTRTFFERVHATMRADMLLVLAELEGRPVAGALNFIGRDALYGRYWGAAADLPFMHFELCYYQAIDWAITQRLARVEAGAQGEHKLARGYLPHETHSLHWIAAPGFHAAVARYLEAERRAVGRDIAELAALGPFRQSGHDRPTETEE